MRVVQEGARPARRRSRSAARARCPGLRHPRRTCAGGGALPRLPGPVRAAAGVNGYLSDGPVICQDSVGRCSFIDVLEEAVLLPRPPADALPGRRPVTHLVSALVA